MEKEKTYEKKRISPIIYAILLIFILLIIAIGRRINNHKTDTRINNTVDIGIKNNNNNGNTVDNNY